VISEWGFVNLRGIKIIWVMVACVGAMISSAYAQTNRPALWFPVGERLVYKVYWGFIPVGYAVTTSEWIEENGKTLLAIRVKTKSNAVIEKIYPVEDYLETIIDPETFLPISFTKKLSEGRYTAHHRTTFDHKNLTAHWEALDEDDDREETFPIEADTRDLITLMYKIREGGFNKDTELSYRVMADEKIYDLIVNKGREEKVELPLYGKMETIKIEPQGKFQGLFVRKGRMWLWVTTDQRCLVAKMAAKVPVASVNMVLLDVTGPGDDSWITDKKGEMSEEEAQFIKKSRLDKEQDKE
jgi:hypothetical protein